MKYDVVIIGAGPAGLFAAHEITEKSSLKVLVIDKGKDINSRQCPSISTFVRCKKCNPCNMLCGLGGAGGLSDGKLNLKANVGGNLEEFVSKEEAQNLISKVEQVFVEHGASGKVYGQNSADLEKRAASCGIQFIPIPQRHIGSDRLPSITTSLKNSIEKFGAKFLLNTFVKEIHHDGCFELQINENEKIEANYILAVPGRSGGDWMALVGLTRDGVLSIPVGTSDALNGTPSDASVWEFIDLGVSLQPNTWYFMKEEADFQKRKFESFTLIGPEVNISVDLSNYNVDYPNYIPIDNRSMTYYVYSIRMAGEVQPRSTTIYFDDVEAGIETDSGYTVIMQDGFETQYTIPNIPITLPVTHISQIKEGFWYKENENALLSVVDTQAHSGSYSCLCNVTLKGLDQIGRRHIIINQYLSHRFFPMLELNSVLNVNNLERSETSSGFNIQCTFF